MRVESPTPDVADVDMEDVDGLHPDDRTEGHSLTVPAGYRLRRGSFNHLREIIYTMSGIHLKDAKQQMVQSRLTKRLRILGLSSFEQYIAYLGEHPEELTDMINRITTNKTYFFREPRHFSFLEEHALPDCIGRPTSVGERRVINGWCAAASTGEEPYSIAMVVAEFLSRYPSWSARILASDLDTAVLAKGIRGEYPEVALQDIPRRYSGPYTQRNQFRRDGVVSFSDPIREMVHFRQINLMAERYPIRTQLDFIFCRNVFIYFTRQDRDRVVHRMVDLLRPGGYLFLGHSEVLDIDMFRGRLRFLANTTYQKAGG